MIAVAGCLQPIRFLENRTLVWFGTLSYGLYLWHVPVMWSGLAPMPVLVGVSILAAWGSFRWVEQPLRKRFHRSGEFDGGLLDQQSPTWVGNRVREMSDAPKPAANSL